jgi:hypothetical protein
MSEPAIDEMLEWLDNPHIPKPYSFFDGIRAILEQHREHQDDVAHLRSIAYSVNRRSELEAIRAFVERVEKSAMNRASDYHGALISYRDVLFAELTEMEAAVKE